MSMWIFLGGGVPVWVESWENMVEKVLGGGGG